MRVFCTRTSSLGDLFFTFLFFLFTSLFTSLYFFSFVLVGTGDMVLASILLLYSKILVLSLYFLLEKYFGYPLINWIIRQYSYSMKSLALLK